MTVTCWMCGREKIWLDMTITGPVYREHADKIGHRCVNGGEPCGQTSETQ